MEREAQQYLEEPIAVLEDVDMAPCGEIDSRSVLVERAHPEDDSPAEALWQSTGVRVAPNAAPATRLVARDAETHRFLGVADYFRTFPPEDVLFAVAVLPDERRHGVGTALLRMLARMALRDGRRSLCTFIAEDDEPTWRLLRAVGIPLRTYELDGGSYVELDLVPLLHEDVPEAVRMSEPAPAAHR